MSAAGGVGERSCVTSIGESEGGGGRFWGCCLAGRGDEAGVTRKGACFMFLTFLS